VKTVGCIQDATARDSFGGGHASWVACAHYCHVTSAGTNGVVDDVSAAKVYKIVNLKQNR